ncbi:MAG: MFS transporter [Desulfurella sp.]|uniref:MFS transporter n=1 Tax=Desulfurella sp. TaxID=1962857 RepID=UPI0003E09C1F|nr:membrane protein [Desulfurella acetivorans A63]
MAEAVAKSAISKVKRFLIPYMFLLYVINFLDRVNLGFAALKMNKDLGLGAEQFGFAAGIFFIGYLIFQVPSNLMLHKIGARVWISLILVIWGFVATLTGFANSPVHLYIARFLLGLAEAGFFPGVILFLTYWFPQRELAQAVALFMTALAFSSVIGSPISGIILDHVHWAGLESWRWLFILEGAPAVIFGILTFFILPNKPSEAKFLTQQERDWLTNEIAQEQAEKAKQQKMTVGEAMKNGRVWLLAFIYFFGLIMGLYSISFWLPQIIKGLSKSYSAQTVGFLAMIPFLFAAIMMVVNGSSADKKAEWRYHTQIPLLVSSIAIFAMLFIKTPAPSIIVLSIVTAGAYAAFGPFWALPNKFLSGAAAAAGIAVINSIGNLGGFFAPYIIGFIKSHTGNVYYGLAAVGVSLLISVILLALLPKEATQGAKQY